MSARPIGEAVVALLRRCEEIDASTWRADGDPAGGGHITTQEVWGLLAEAGAPAEQDDAIRDALAELVSLKDGPRDRRYRARKDWAWSNARRALTAAGVPTVAERWQPMVAAQDGKPGCPAEVWDDGVYRNRCSRGIDECGRHGHFAVRLALAGAADTEEPTDG